MSFDYVICGGKILLPKALLSVYIMLGLVELLSILSFSVYKEVHIRIIVTSFEMLTLQLSSCCGTITLPLPLPADNRPTECVHTTKIPGRISRCVSQIQAKAENLFLKYSYQKMSKRKNTVKWQYYLIIILFLLHKLHSDGAHGCKSLPSDSDGARP